MPWLYIGMLFSSFCWHNEDNYLYRSDWWSDRILLTHHCFQASTTCTSGQLRLGMASPVGMPKPLSVPFKTICRKSSSGGLACFTTSSLRYFDATICRHVTHTLAAEPSQTYSGWGSCVSRYSKRRRVCRYISSGLLSFLMSTDGDSRHTMLDSVMDSTVVKLSTLQQLTGYLSATKPSTTIDCKSGLCPWTMSALSSRLHAERYTTTLVKQHLSSPGKSTCYLACAARSVEDSVQAARSSRAVTCKGKARIQT